MTMPVTATDQARQVLALLPVLRRWVTTRVQLASADLDLSLRQFAALHSIRDGAESPGELARLWQVTPAVLTGVVDRLERRGLVRREVDANDRRRQRLALTAAGLAASEDVEQALLTELAAQLATASTEELAALGRSIALLERSLLALEEGTPPAATDCASDENWRDDERREADAPRTVPLEEASRTLVGAER